MENQQDIEQKKTKNQIYYEKNKERMKEYMKTYRSKNNDKIKQYQIQYYQTNKNKFKCEICNVNFCSKKDYNAHLLTKKHIKKSQPQIEESV
jgi:hypothetical protein